MSAFILGSTGLVGTQIVRSLEKSTAFSTLYPISRKSPTDHSLCPKINLLIEPNTGSWPGLIKSHPNTTTLISSLGSTITKAGSKQAFHDIDYGLNYSVAKSAKENGTKTMILISSVGAHPDSWFHYLKTKGELERDVKELGFDHTVIIRPGALLGKRESSIGWRSEVGMWFGRVAKNTPVRRLLNPIEDFDVARVVVDFAERAEKGDLEKGVTIVEPHQLVDLANKLVNN
ncbi:protein FMP52, mitochondrial [Spathaspora passalidarum NRRL Y-27907]|uniref:Protein FMP52, mitochondrial n=1 Tax=Spathaspora passalidarum (strain NRRL Y-27907 / 11-Y1) TaxID=619300 RepID=G3ANS4_SPAPN|nr:protein FMP52, mitochondrial [Spathaspora passalidarum NRRL Y-27907]EGW32009.1 protein FMP52, mitochondrial [Spathaspora passalidarum NRRL Y-27907]